MSTIHRLDFGARAPSQMLLFGGPYSNLAATRAMRTEAERRGILPAQVLCTGDIVAYCARPQETVDLIRDWGIHVVMGNCEESLAENAEDCGCGFEEGTACSVLSDSWYRYSQARINDDARAWMGALPRQITFRLGDQTFAVVHGGVRQINQFIFASTPNDIKRAELEKAGTDVVIGGHCGLPFGHALEPDDPSTSRRTWWLNAGAIGMPANDRSQTGFYLILERVENAVTASWHRLGYDAEQEAAAMRARGLNNGYADALLSGLWPSTDVLPESETARTGKPIQLTRHLLQ